MLKKDNSSIVERNSNVTIIEIKRFSPEQGVYPVSTVRYCVYSDGNVLTQCRDDIEGSDFRDRNRFSLENVELKGDQQIIHAPKVISIN